MMTTEAFGGHGGIAKYNRDFLSALCDMPECEEVVALPRLMPQNPGPLPGKLRYDLSGLAGKLKYAIGAIRSVRRDYDLVVCGHINLLPLAWLMKLLCRTPVVLIIYGIDAWHPRGVGPVRFLLRFVRAVISISDVTRGKFCEWASVDAQDIFILPNAIDLSRYGPGPKSGALLRRYALTDKIVIMSLGRLSRTERYKGIDEVLEILPSLLRTVPDLVYLVVGEGSDRARLEQKALSLGIADYVVFTGQISESEKADHYRLADAFVLPSRGEGFGFVFLEAMASGIPVVASKLDGGREAVRQGQLGILVNPDDREELAAGIRKALTVDKGVPKGLEYFSYEQFRRRVHETLRQIVPKVIAGKSG